MRNIAIILNIIAIIILVFSIIAIDDWEYIDIYAILMMIAVFFFLIINIIALFSQKSQKNWLFLYIRRKALEEQKKIEELSSGKKN